MVTNKITKKEIDKMKSLRKKGLSYADISMKLSIPQGKVYYHLSEEYREKVKERVRKWREKNKSNKYNYKEYQRKYQKEKYSNDPEFRKKQIERSKKYNKENKK